MAHTIEQPGLHDYSWRPEDDLMKQFVVEKSRAGRGTSEGWTAVSSFHTFAGAANDVFIREAKSVYLSEEDGFWNYTEHRVRDQFKDEVHTIGPDNTFIDNVLNSHE